MKILAAVLTGIFALGVGKAYPQDSDFYKDRQITLFVGYAPGGGYDAYARIAARYLGTFIPGTPRIVVQHRPGAGSVVLANDLFNTLSRDGSVVGMFNNSLHLWELLGQENIRFRATRFNWIGRITDADDVMSVRPSAGVTKFADAITKEITIGVPGSSSSPALMVGALNSVLGTKFRMIPGYTGSTEIRLAVERGEVDGTQSLLWSVDGDWVKQNKLTVLYRVSSSDIAGLEDVPTLLQFAKTEDEKKLISFFSSYTDVGRSITAPPDVPASRVETLRTAFIKAVATEGFRKEIEKSNLRLSPLAGDKLQDLVLSAFDLSDELKQRARIAAGLVKPAAK